MTTIVNNPTPTSDSNNSGLIIGILFIVVLAVLFYMYGLPAINNMRSPQINIPSEIDVNIEQK